MSLLFVLPSFTIVVNYRVEIVVLNFTLNALKSLTPKTTEKSMYNKRIFKSHTRARGANFILFRKFKIQKNNSFIQKTKKSKVAAIPIV